MGCTRLVRGLTPEPGGHVDVLVWRGLVAAHVPVGWCWCGGYVYGGEARPVRPGCDRYAFGLTCATCQHESVWLAVPTHLAPETGTPGVAVAVAARPRRRRVRRVEQLALPLAS